MSRHSDILFLEAALELAALGRNSCAPNPPVGCIIAREGKVIGRGCHLRAGHAHAEVNALADASHSVAGATVYVTLEPCSHFGKTPPCCDRIIAQGIPRVVIGIQDPHKKVAGQGIKRLQDARCKLAVGVHDPGTGRP